MKGAKSCMLSFFGDFFRLCCQIFLKFSGNSYFRKLEPFYYANIGVTEYAKSVLYPSCSSTVYITVSVYVLYIWKWNILENTV